MKRFYSSNIKNDTAILEGSERDHCIRVMRTVPDEVVEIVDGRGGLWTGSLSDSDKRQAIVRLVSNITTDRPLSYQKPVIATAIPKSPARWESFLEKATEIGVETIIPLVSRRSEKRRIRTERSEQIILSAFKQSKHLHLPALRPVQSIKDLIAEYTSSESEKFIAYLGTEENPYLGVIHETGMSSIILIGPEGDFTAEEVSLALASGFKGVSLGDSVLRVETAGVAACNIIQCSEHIRS